MKIPTYDNQTLDIDLSVKGNLVALPALIDPHVHFRTPGDEQKEDWRTGSRAAIAGGATTVFDMPNNSPSITTKALLDGKREIIKQQLQKADIPLHYYLYIGAAADNMEEIEKSKDEIIGIKIFMGSSTGDLLLDKKEEQAKIFELAAKLNLVVAVHAEDEKIIREQQAVISEREVKFHSRLRPREAAIKATTQAIELAEKYGTKLYVLHITTKEEVEIVRKAKLRGIRVFAEVTPHHLFLTELDYAKLGTKAQMNPPLRTFEDQNALWQGISEGIIDTIGTDHAPHTIREKEKPYGHAPSGVPGIETSLPLLLNAHNDGKISLQKIVELTRTNIEKIFKIKSNKDWVIVDLNLEKEVDNKNLKTKCKWSPFAGWKLKGWPVATLVSNKKFIIHYS